MSTTDEFMGPQDVRNGHAAPGGSPFNNPQKDREVREEIAANKALVEQYGWQFYSLADLHDRTDTPTVRKYVQKVERENLRHGPMGPPVLFVRGSDLIDKHVPEAELRALAPIDDAQVGDLKVEAAAIQRARQDEVRQRAAILEAERLASGLEMPELVNLAEHVPEPVRWIAEGLWRHDAHLGLYAERKAGKSTAVREIIRALIEQSPVFGHFPVTFDATAPIILIDSEMSVDYLHEEYIEAGFTPEMLDRVRLYSIRGRERTFDVRSEQIRAWWEQQIPEGAVVIFDCLYAVLAAIGLSENDDMVSEFTIGLRALITAAKARGSILVHHLGKDAERGARGHGSIEGFADSMAYIRLHGPIYDPDTERTLTLTGRVDPFKEHVMALGKDGRITLESREDQKAQKKAETRETQDQQDERTVLGTVRAHPGLTKSELESFRGKLGEKRFRSALTRLETCNIIENRGNKAKAAIYATSKGAGDVFGTPAEAVAELADDAL